MPVFDTFDTMSHGHILICIKKGLTLYLVLKHIDLWRPSLVNLVCTEDMLPFSSGPVRCSHWLITNKPRRENMKTDRYLILHQRYMNPCGEIKIIVTDSKSCSTSTLLISMFSGVTKNAITDYKHFQYH